MSELRAALEAAYPEEEKEEQTPVVETTTETPVVEATPEPTVQEAVTKATEEPKVEEPPKVEETPKAEEAPKTEEKPKEEELDEVEKEFRSRVDRAPQSWKGDTRKEWEKLPLSVRQEIVKRERDIDNALRQAAPHKEFYEGFSKVVAPYAPRFKAVGLDPISGIGRLLEADRKLSSGTQAEKAAMVAELIGSYKIDLAALDDYLSKNPASLAASNPMVTAITEQVTRQLQPVLNQIPRQQPVQQPDIAPQIAMLEEMQQDKENFPHLIEVAEDMADLIEAYGKKGVAIDLKQAYSRAVRLHPTIGPELEAKAVEQKARAQAEQAAKAAHDAAQKAKLASSSMSGAPLVSGPSGITDPTNLRSVIEQAMDRISSGSNGRV